MVNWIVTQFDTGLQTGIDALETAIEAIDNGVTIHVVPIYSKGAGSITLLIQSS